MVLKPELKSDVKCICWGCEHKPLADVARTLIAALEEEFSTESAPVRTVKISTALGALRDLVFEETQ